MGFVVADGVGGHGGGEVASRIAVDMFEQALLASPHDLNLVQLMLAIHYRVVERQGQDPAWRSMATTCTSGVIRDSRLDFAHCGDTRLVLQRGKGIRRLTVDHTEAQQLLTSGQLTPTEFRSYPRKNILTSALGVHGTPHIDQGIIKLETGDRVMSFSDGVYGRLPLRALKTLSDRCSDAEGLVDAVVNEVNRRKPNDNFSIVAVFCS
ncbi:MAG: serine/threonine-protein phosphatase [Bosea sp.]|nr:serine/threonine-protein phosphatase [Bosea sp. (in: a-proteobacteria)]